MPLIEPVRIDGWRELVRSLRAVGPEAVKAIRLGANKAAEIVAADARGRMPSRSGRARASVKAQSTRTAARVSSGGRRAPYVPWLDYGGSVGRNNTARRPFIADGRYVYPAFRARRADFERVLIAELAAAAQAAGLES